MPRILYNPVVLIDINPYAQFHVTLIIGPLPCKLGSLSPKSGSRVIWIIIP